VREHAKAVRTAGHRVVVLHLPGQRRRPERSLWTLERELDPALSEGIEAYRVSHRPVGVRGASYPLFLWSAVSAYRRLRDGGFHPDVIHAHVYGAGVPAAIAASRSGIPLVITEHFSGIAQRSLSRVEARKARFAYNRAARILPVSGFLQEAIEAYGIHRPFEVVPNVVDTSVFFPPDGVPRQDCKRRLLFVGNLEPLHLKGFPTLLLALARLRETSQAWKLDVIGGGPERSRDERSAADLGLGEHVTFHGPQQRHAVAQAMREADLLIQPSRVETFGTVIAEALVSGLPVVSTAVGDIPERLDERGGRLVPPDDPAALAKLLADTLEELDAFDRAAISKAARDRYGLNVVGEQLSRVYESVLGESSLGTASGGDVSAKRRTNRLTRRT
jgi:L-malate glycosyltransferase